MYKIQMIKSLKPFLGLCLCGGLLFFGACDSAVKQDLKHKNRMAIGSLSGQVYAFLPELDTVQCKVSGGCDCCATTFLFLNSTQFVCISYCVPDRQFNKGNYKIQEDRVLLHFDSVRVSQAYNTAIYADSAAKPEYFIEKEHSDTITLALQSFYCEEKLGFKMRADQETFYGMRDEARSLAQHINLLKTEGVWSVLNP